MMGRRGREGLAPPFPLPPVSKILYKQREEVLNEHKELELWVNQININEDFSECTVEKRRNLFKRAKEIRKRGELAKVVYNRLVSYEVLPWNYNYSSIVRHALFI